MTDKEFLELYDTDRNKLEEVFEEETEDFCPDEWLEVHQVDIVVDDIDLYKSAEWGKYIYKIGDRYFSAEFTSSYYGREIYYDFTEVQKKTYSKRVEVTEWLSMPD